MFTKLKLVPALALALASLAPTASFAQAQEGAPCILREHRVTTVVPYRTAEQLGKAAVQRLRGASVFVQAEPGLTAEWLQLKLQRHLTAMRSSDMRDCAFDIENVRVDVDSGGTGFWVRLIAPDTERGEEVLRRARLLLA
jgi:hypothetical protein